MSEDKNKINEDINSNENDDSEKSELNNNQILETKNKEEIKEDKKEDTKNKLVINSNSKNKKYTKIVLISVISFLALIIISLVSIVCINKFNKNVYKNIYLYEINLSGKSRDQLEEVVNELSNNVDNKKIDVYQDDEIIYSINANDVNLKIDVQKTLDNIMSIGRTGNIINDNIEIIKLFFGSKKIKPEFTYDNGKFDEALKNIKLSIKDLYSDDSYSVDEKNHKLVIVRGKTGNSIDTDLIKDKILQNFIDKDSISYTLELITENPKELDVHQVYNEVKREAKDAYIDESVSPVNYVSEVVGYDFDIEELNNLLSLPENKEQGKTIEFNLKVIEPSKKLADIAPFNDLLATYTTYFPTGDTARCNNLRIALSYMNGIVIMPGQVYSYNNNIGDTTYSKGYLPAATFKGGTTVNELGGGICQTVSTLYNVALYANLEIVERHQHGLPVGYVPPSRDATVYSPSLDFKFKNTRKYPVKIVTSYNTGSLTVSIYGTKEDKEYEVIISHNYLSTIPAPVNYIYDTNLAPGQQVVVSNGANGYTSEAYITKKLNGVVVSSSLLSSDKYNAQAKIIRVGAGGS